MTKSKIFFILSLSFIGGIFLASFYQKIIENYFFSLSAALLMAPMVVFYKNKKVYVAAFAGLFFVFGFWLADIKLGKINSIDSENQIFSGQAIVIREPENNGIYQKIVAKISLGSSLGSEASKSGKVLVNTSLYPEYFYGDEISLNCTLEIPKNFSEEFDYKMYLAKDRIYHICSGAKIELLSRNNGNKFYSSIINVKNRFQNSMEELIPFPEAGLLSGLLLGGDDRLSKEIQENFSRTGMTHIVAVSGYNVTIIAEYLMIFGILIGLWRKQAFWFALVGIFLFVLMIGFPSSAVRAGVMGSLLLWAMKNGRLANSRNAIVASAVIMLLINPLLLRWDVGFQLSFLATLGIIYLYPILENNLIEKNKASGIIEILFLTVSAQIFVLPVILTNFGRLSLISPLANVLVLPIIPLTMAFGFLAVFLKLFFAPLATVFSWMAYLPLKYEIEVINFLARLKWANVDIERFNWQWSVVWYVFLAAAIFFLNKRSKYYGENK